MLKAVTINNLRGVRTGTVGELSPLSVLVGPNNCGKSTVLEAIAIGGADHTVSGLVQLLGSRANTILGGLRPTVTVGVKEENFDEVASVSFEGHDGPIGRAELRFIHASDVSRVETARSSGLTGTIREVSLNWVRDRSPVVGKISAFIDANGAVSSILQQQAPALFPYGYVGCGGEPDVTLAIAMAERGGTRPQLVEALKASMPGLRDLRALPDHDGWAVHCEFENSPPVPVCVAGAGFKRVIHVAAACWAAGAGATFLVDEPETSLHPRYQREIARILLAAANSGVQVVVATHSLELIRALLEYESPDKNWPTVHRLTLEGGTLSASMYSRPKAIILGRELENDLRG